MLHDVHDRSFYLSCADASARAAACAPTRDIAVAHLEMKAIYLRKAGELDGRSKIHLPMVIRPAIPTQA